MSEAPRPGLEGVVVADTVLSHADPESGLLWIRGRPLADLIARHGHEGTIALVWEGFAGTGLTRAAVAAELGAERRRAFARLGGWLQAASGRPIDEAVRILLAAVPDDAKPATICASLAVGVPAVVRAASGSAPLAPDPDLPAASDLLRMLHGAPADAAAARALDTYLTAMIDSGLSPSTFTARTVASTRASLAASVLAAWCAFTGPLHGGAPGPTLDLLDEAAAAPDLDAMIERKLAGGERLMGFGHRVYRGNDPRAAAMRLAVQGLASSANRLALAARLEERVAAVVARAKPGRALPANVELVAAVLLEAVGIPRAAFTAVFAVARTPGWIAHALEQQAGGRMIRPASRYVGPPVSSRK